MSFEKLQSALESRGVAQQEANRLVRLVQELITRDVEEIASLVGMTTEQVRDGLLLAVRESVVNHHPTQGYGEQYHPFERMNLAFREAAARLMAKSRRQMAEEEDEPARGWAAHMGMSAMNELNDKGHCRRVVRKSEPMAG